MSVTVEAVYEAGVLKPLTPLSDLREHEKVRITVEALPTVGSEISLIDEQRKKRVQIEPHIAREIGDSHEFDLSES